MVLLVNFRQKFYFNFAFEKHFFGGDAGKIAAEFLTISTAPRNSHVRVVSMEVVWNEASVLQFCSNEKILSKSMKNLNLAGKWFYSILHL